MRRWWRWVAVLLLLAGLAWFFWPRGPRVVLVGVDGGADYLLDEYLSNGTLSADGGFATLARRGVRAEASVPINASVTAPSFASLFTGAYPERHGLMSNIYYRVRDPLGQTRSAFYTPLQAEPIWQPLRRAGKRVVLVGQDIGVATPGLGPDLVFGFGARDGTSQLAELGREDFAATQGWKFGQQRFEHAQGAAVEFATERHGEHTAHLLLVDTVADGVERYDRLLIDFDRNLANGVAAELKQGAWAAVRLPVERPTTIGVWVKLLALEGDLSRVRLYVGPPHYNRGKPVEFVQRVERALARPKSRFAGGADGQPFWPGERDSEALGRGWIDEATWFEQSERLGNYIRDAALWVMANERFDLMITYQLQADSVGHQFLLRHPRQAGYGDPELRARLAENVARGWRAVDVNLKALVAAAGPQTNVMVMADHGMYPVHTVVFLNRLLEARGFRVRGPEAEVGVISFGGGAHIYVNLAGRQPGGVVAAGEYPKLVERLVELFEELRDPVTQEPVLEVVARRNETRAFRILHEETSGDVWLSAKPGYIFRAIDVPGDVFKRAGLGLRGGHGYLAKFREMQAIFLAAGPHIRHTELGVVNNVDVAPTVAALLGASPPRDAQGQALIQIVKPKKRDN
ncbi:MAG: alkaline phosphatase family protein [Terriglobia bacterium]